MGKELHDSHIAFRESVTMTANVLVLLSGGVFENRLPATNAWIVLKVEDNNKKPVSIPSAGTVADSVLQPKLTTSRHTCSNTFVSGWHTVRSKVCCQFFV